MIKLSLRDRLPPRKSSGAWHKRGGFFNANSAQSVREPDASHNFLEMLAILSIGSGLTYTLGRMVGNQRHGWALLAAMSIPFCRLSLWLLLRSARQS